MSHPKPCCSTKSGFTLLEVLVALAIMTMAMIALYSTQGGASRAMGRGRQIQIASFLAEKTMNEKLLEIEAEIAKGSLPDELEENGEYEGPFAEYRWSLQINKIELPLAGQIEGDQESANQNQASGSQQTMIAKTISKLLEESI